MDILIWGGVNRVGPLAPPHRVLSQYIIVTLLFVVCILPYSAIWGFSPFCLQSFSKIQLLHCDKTIRSEGGRAKEIYHDKKCWTVLREDDDGGHKTLILKDTWANTSHTKTEPKILGHIHDENINQGRSLPPIICQFGVSSVTPCALLPCIVSDVELQVLGDQMKRISGLVWYEQLAIGSQQWGISQWMFQGCFGGVMNCE